MDKNQYQNTLNLPQTDFPMRGNLAVAEPKQLARWDSQNIYQKLRKNRQGAPRFILHDGPPYANGDIHIGHALNKILKDIIVKSQSMNGKDAPYLPGWDCHGLPIEWQMEKKYGKVGKKLDEKAFRQKCREHADVQIERQKADFLRLGIMGNWQQPYKTKDFSFEAAEIRALAKMLKNGHVRRGVKSVYWSVGCVSALAEAEVEYEDKVSNAIDVAFKAHHPEAIKQQLKIDFTELFAVIWTTTPWTMPANQAICLNADLDYVVVAYKGASYLLAKDLVTECAQRYEWDESAVQIQATFLGKEMEGVLFEHPLYGRTVPMVLGEHVTTESGTGCVHTAPAHGPDDFDIGLKYDLDTHCPVDENGVFLNDVPLFGGQFVFKAEDGIIEVLQKNQRLLKHELFKHSYPHCWRTKTPLIYRATSQWFIRMDKLREPALEAIDKLTFTPSWGRSRLKGMIENRPDWCISRQRYWGVPIPLFTHKVTGEMHPDTAAIMERVAEAVALKGIDAWFDSCPEDWLANESADYEQTRDILDVWFDSGVTHYGVGDVRDEVSIPADLYLEGSDQHRGWFQSSLLTSVGMHGKPPYKGLLTHGFTVDENGRKMSKSIGNVIAPQKICNTYGADILRLWVASSDYRQELAVSDEIIKYTADAYRRIRNTARFMLSNLYDFNPETDCVKPDDMVWLDRWAMDLSAHLQTKIVTAYDDYRFHLIYQELHNFATVDMGGFYLDIIKDRLYTAKKDGLARRSAQTALYHIIQAMTHWIAPILSFTAEEIWRHIPKQKSESIFLQSWYGALTLLPNNTSFDGAYWQQIQSIKTMVGKQLEVLRQQGHIGSSLDAEVDLYVTDEWFDRLALLEDELRFILITSYARIHPLSEAPAKTNETEIEGIRIQAFASQYEKCARSWHRRESVNKNPDYPQLDDRSIINLSGSGEKRLYA